MEKSKPAPESLNTPKPYFETAVRRDYEPSYDAPIWKVKNQLPETLPKLTSGQLNKMQSLRGDEVSPDNIAKLGLPLGEGPVAVLVDGEEVFVNISLEDYGTTIPAKRIEIIDAAPEELDAEAIAEPETKETGVTDLVKEEIGEEALEVSGIDKPKRPEIKLKPGDMARAAEQIGRIIGDDATKGNAVSRVLGELGQEPSQIRDTLNPNTGDPEARQALLLALEREIDYLGEANKLPERVQDNLPQDEKHSVRGYGHDRDKYPPREYAARLALAMLDGSFDYEAARMDYHDDLPSDHPHNGQHRQAARMALEASYQSEAAEEDTIPAENEQLKNYFYGLRSTLPNSIDSMNFISSSVLGHLREDLYRDVVDIDTLAGDAIELTTRVEAALSRLSTDNFNLRAIINQNPEMTPADRTLTQQAEAELSNIVAQLDNMRNDEVYYRLQATIHNADQMNLVALKGNLSKGSFDELDHNIQALRARLEALSQIQI